MSLYWHSIYFHYSFLLSVNLKSVGIAWRALMDNGISCDNKALCTCGMRRCCGLVRNRVSDSECKSNRNLVGGSFGRCLGDRLLSGSSIWVTTRSFGCALRRALYWELYRRISSLINTLIKTSVRNKYLFVLDFIVHYYNMFRPRSVAIFR
jgi:hypothetical protein